MNPSLRPLLFSTLLAALLANGCAATDADEEADAATTEDALSIPVDTDAYFWEVETPTESLSSLLPSKLSLPARDTAKALFYVARYKFPFKSVIEGTLLIPDVSFAKKHDCEDTPGEKFYFLARTTIDSSLFKPSYLPYTRHIETGDLGFGKEALSVSRGDSLWKVKLSGRIAGRAPLPMDTSRKVLGELPHGVFATHSLEFDVRESARFEGSFAASGSDFSLREVSTRSSSLAITYVSSRAKLSHPSYCH